MAHQLEVKIIQNYEELKPILSKIKEVLNSNREVTIAWKKTLGDIYEETFYQNRPIQDQKQYRILQNLSQNIPSNSKLSNEILLTLMEYEIEQKDYQKFQLNFKRLSTSQHTENSKLQVNELLKKMKKQLKLIVDIEERFSLIQILYQENLLSKEELKQLYQQIKPNVKENPKISIWFLEEILSYEKQNQLLLCEICEYYIQEQNQEQTQKYVSLIVNQPLSDLNFEEIQSEYQEIKTKNYQMIQEIQEIEESLNNNQSNQVIEQLQNLIVLKTGLGQPISEMVFNYQKLSQNLFQQKDISKAIEIIQSCLNNIKIELLINYNSKLILQESVCYEILGNCYRLQNQIDLALDAYQDSLTLKKEIKHNTDPKKIIYIKLHMAAMYFKIKDYQKALEIYADVLKLQEADVNEVNQLQLIGQTQYNIASIYFNLGKRQIAEEFCEQAITSMSSKLEDQDPMMKKVKALREKIIQIKTSRLFQ